MKKKWITGTCAVCLATALFGQGITALADAEHVTGTNAFTYTLPADAAFKSHGKLEYTSGEGTILIDSGDLNLLQAELNQLFGEIDPAYSTH